ncbi:MAG: cytochrome c-type biogenesis protein CcmH [Chloroflexota bacterium]
MKRGFWVQAAGHFGGSKIGVLLVVALVSLALVGVARAQDATPTTPTDDQVNAIAKQMFCPVCENTPLDVCPTQACAEWRELIREKLALGWSEAQIKEYFVEQFGARVLAEPPRSGLHWLIYIVPPVTFLAGVFILYRTFRAWRLQTANETITPEASVPADNEYIDQLEDELRKLQEKA